MGFERVGLLSNPYSGTGRERVLALARDAFACVAAQADVLVGPGDLGADAAAGRATVVGTDASRTRRDTIATVRAMIDAGAQLIVIVSGDGTYNDALEGMKAAGATVPIFGIAAGRFNTQFPRRRHDPFVSLRGDVRPFRLADLVVDDVPGMVARVDGEIAGYGVFWTTISNALAYSDPDGKVVIVDAARMLAGEVVPLAGAWPVAVDDTRIVIASQQLGEIELARGPDLALPVVAQIVPELNQILAGGFGAFAEFMGFHGVAYCFRDRDLAFLPTPPHFPVDTRSVAFFAGDQVRMTGLRDGAVLQIDSTPIRTVRASDVVTVEVVAALGQKARLAAAR
jgi:ATP-NAD kinase N-terminal domain